MPVTQRKISKGKISKGKNKGKVTVRTPGGVKAKATTPEKAAAQTRLLNAIEHNPNFKPRGSADGKKKSGKKAAKSKGHK